MRFGKGISGVPGVTQDGTDTSQVCPTCGSPLVGAMDAGSGAHVMLCPQCRGSSGRQRNASELSQEGVPVHPGTISGGGQAFLGGMRWSGPGGTWNASWLLARLEVSDKGIVLGPSIPFLVHLFALGAMPTIHAAWSDIAGVERVHWPLTKTPGLRLYVRGADHPVIFTRWNVDPIIGAMEARGVAVAGSSVPMRWTRTD